MLRGSKTPLKVKENESGCRGRDEEASFPPSRDQKSCKVTKPKAIRPSKKENVADGSQPRPPKRALKCPSGPGENLGQPQGSFGVLGEPPWPLHPEEAFCVPWGNGFSTPERDRGEGKAEFGLSEERKKVADFAAVITAELGAAQEGFGKGPKGASPTSLKLRRRSTIGLRGSPENNTLIRYLAQQRSSRQGGAFTQISPFKPANVRSLKDKIDAFQASFESLQEAEGEAGLPHLGEPSQQRGSSQDKEPFKKEPDPEQWSEKFTLGGRGNALRENWSEDGTRSSRSEPRICSILSLRRAGSVPDPAAEKEWVCEQQNPLQSLETAVTGDPLETEHVARCGHGGSAALSDLEDVSLGVLGAIQAPGTPLGAIQAPGTPLGAGTIPDPSQSSSLLRSILKKTPGTELRDGPKEHSNSATDRGGGESAAVSNCVKALETLQRDTSDNQSSKTPKKKKVTFGQVLSPEIFDQSLPANTPLRRGASPGCPQAQSPRPSLSEEPLPLLDFGWDEEGVEPLPEFLEGSVAAEAPSAAENAEVAETAKPDMATTRASTKRKQGRAVAEGSELSSSGDTNSGSDKDTENPRRSKVQRQRNPSTAAPKKTQKTKYPSYGKRRKKKVKKSLYGEREMASKKPLLSPILEIPEVFSLVSSPNSPKADALFTEAAAWGNPKPKDTLQAGRTCGTELRASPEPLEEAAAPSPGGPEGPGGLQGAPGSAAEFSKAVPDAEGDLDTPECFQQGKDTPCEKAAKASSSLTGKEELEGNLLTGLEILEPQDVQEHPPKASVRADPARRRRRSSSSAFNFPPVENVEITEGELPACSYSVEEVLSLQGCSAQLRVRRSMRLSRDAATRGLAWVQLPWELPRARRSSSSTSILAGAENLHPREKNPLPIPAPGKENEGSAPAAAGRRWRRRSLLEGTETPWAPSQRRRSTNSACGKDRSDQKHSGAAETLELRWKDAPGIPDFLK